MDYLPSLTVRQLMNPRPVLVTPDQAISDVVRIMNQNRIGAVIVRGDNGHLGIFTERDVLRQAVEASHGWWERPVGDWMTREPTTIHPDMNWEHARMRMKASHVRHLPVVEDGRVVGIVTSRDLMTYANEHLNHVVEQRTKELRETMERLQHRDDEMQLHMRVAGRIQTRLLPQEVPNCPELVVAAHYEPLDPLGGDYYDFARPTNDHVGLLIADATGHSIPAAMVAIMGCTVFASTARIPDPAAALKAMNRQLHGLTGEHFVSAFYGMFHRSTHQLVFANAGHPYPYHYDAARHLCEPLQARGLMLGIMDDAVYESTAIQLAPGDRLLLYTDGIPDCRNDEDHTYGMERIGKFLLNHHAASAKSIATGLAEELRAFRGSKEAFDDMTILAVEIH